MRRGHSARRIEDKADVMNRDELLDDIAAEYGQTAKWTGRTVPSARLMTALAKVPRDEFVPPGEKDVAYENTALPIGCGQTISQPYIVAIMTDLLDLAPTSTVLEIGTGSGYQAAILAELGARVFTVEIVPELAARSRMTLQRLGYSNVEVRAGDGSLGWPEAAPFDGIIVTAAARDVPPALVAQLKPGGNMVIPLGEPGDYQVLTVVTKTASGALHRRDTIPVAFVPFTGAARSNRLS